MQALDLSNPRKLLTYAFFLLNLGVILYFWFTISGPLLTTGPRGIALALGRLSGLLATYSVLWQFLMLGRSRWLESVFGLDRLTRIHHTNGLIAFGLIIAHPILTTIGYGGNFFEQLWQLITTYPYVWLAAIGWLLFITIVTASLAIVRLHLKYDTWFYIHLFNYVAILSVILHQITVGGDLLADPSWRWYWLALYAFTFANVIIFRIARPAYFFWRHRFRIDRLEPETDNVTSIYVTGTELDRFPAQAGQFIIWRFLDPRLFFLRQAHPFSISAVPNGRHLRLTPKSLGDFTNRIRELKPGTMVLVDGPYGLFTAHLCRRDKALMIAGGIGITPIRSVSEVLLRQGKQITLLYGNRNQQEIVFKDELEALAQQFPLTIHHIMSDQADWPGERGRVDQAMLARLTPDFAERDIYLCGPPPMMKGLRDGLAKAGVPDSQIHWERFSL